MKIIVSNINLNQKSSQLTIYKISLIFLLLSSWISGIFFALYIFGFYILANTVSDVEAWNNVLPRLYSPEKPAAMTGMISHFFFGSILLILGPVQFSKQIRKKYTDFHRWVGIFYTLSAFITGFGGLVFLVVWGATGGMPMLIGFSVYGLLMMITAVQTIRFALKQDITQHYQWAVRLFALVLGSWIYRMGYGFIHVNLQDWGLGKNFSGPLDYFMDFAFFVIPMLVAEIVIRSKSSGINSIWRVFGSTVCIVTGILIWQATLYFLDGSWGKTIAIIF